MAHHQLLLLALTVVVVGTAGALGVRAFAEGRQAADTDAVVAGLVRAASEAQAWKARPALLGGGASADGFDGVGAAFDRLGWARTPWPASATPSGGGPAGGSCYGPAEGAVYCPSTESGGPLVVYAVSGPAVVAVATVRGTEAGDISTEVLL